MNFFIGRLQWSIQWSSNWFVKPCKSTNTENSSWFCPGCETNKTVHFSGRFRLHWKQHSECGSCWIKERSKIGCKSHPESTIRKTFCQRQWHIETASTAAKWWCAWYTSRSCWNLWHVRLQNQRNQTISFAKKIISFWNKN